MHNAKYRVAKAQNAVRVIWTKDILNLDSEYDGFGGLFGGCGSGGIEEGFVDGDGFDSQVRKTTKAKGKWKGIIGLKKK